MQPQRKRQLARLEGFQAHARINVFLEDSRGVLRRHLFNFHSTRGRRHKHRPRLGAINHDSQIEFFFDGQSFFDQQPANYPAFRPGLVRHQRHAENLARQLGRVRD